MLKVTSIIFLFLLMLLTACHKEQPAVTEIPEFIQTVRDTAANIDSPGLWNGSHGQHWIIATAKGTHELVVSDLKTGETLHRIGRAGNEEGQFDRPNGISIHDSLLFVVERDNHRVQILTIPGFRYLGSFGREHLIKPYGLYVQSVDDTLFQVYVTDNYETEGEEIPPDSELNRRIKKYKLVINRQRIIPTLMSEFGDTTVAGHLEIVESIFGDPHFNNLLIAEENTEHPAVKVYDFDGRFTGKSFGQNLFKGQVEGIALWATSDSSGYWIVTDQSHTANIFHLFDRRTFEWKSAFSGPNTTNTDGIWLDITPLEAFPEGVFLAVHDDGNVSVMDLALIRKTLRL
jgi:3-phytase